MNNYIYDKNNYKRIKPQNMRMNAKQKTVKAKAVVRVGVGVGAKSSTRRISAGVCLCVVSMTECIRVRSLNEIYMCCYVCTK